jgi:hypothetical protein
MIDVPYAVHILQMAERSIKRPFIGIKLRLIFMIENGNFEDRTSVHGNQPTVGG